MELEIAHEFEKEHQFVELSEEEVRKCGWRYFRTSGRHVFTIVIPQTLTPENSFDRGFVFARHQVKARNSQDLLPGSHFDRLTIDRSQNPDLMITVYGPHVGHGNFIVLKRI